MLKNNAFTLDDNAMHSGRISILKTGIAKYGAEIGFSPEEIAEIEDYVARYEGLDSAQNKESAEAAGVYAGIQDYEEKARKQLYRCRKLVRGESLVSGEESRNYLDERFMLGAKVPKRRAEFIAMAENMLEAHNALPAEQPDAVFPPQPFDALREKLTKLKEAMEPASRERAEKKAAIAARRELRKEGNRILQRVYLRAVSFWGIDEPRLLELGMLPKSQVWTPKKKKEGEPE